MEDDSFGFQIGLQNQPMTKRGMLSISSAVFDPLGFVSPFIVKAKLLFQQLCKLGCGWDENMPKEIEQQWALWVENLPYVQELTIPRCIKPLQANIYEAEFHHLANASEAASGTVSYIRFYSEVGHIHTSLLASKSLLAPIKSISIPRL